MHPTSIRQPKKGQIFSWRRAFLTALAETGSVSRAARQARVHRDTVYHHRARNAAFALAWNTSLHKFIGLADLKDVEKERDADVGRLVNTLVQRHGSICLSANEDAEVPAFRVLAFADKARPAATAGSLLAAVRAAAGEPPPHRCSSCGKAMERRRKKSGGSMPCKKCEAGRIRAYKVRLRAGEVQRRGSKQDGQ